MAAQLGVSAGAMKQLQIEGRIAGVGLQSIYIASNSVSKALEDSSGSGKKAASVFRELGISLQDSTGRAREEGAVTLDTIEALSKVTSETKRTRDEFDLFGRFAGRDVQIIVEQLDKLKAAATDIGVDNLDDLQRSLAAGAEQINKAGAAWDLFKAKLAEKIAPVVIPVIRVFTDIVSGKTPGPRPGLAAGTGEGFAGDIGAINGQTDESIDALGAARRGDLGGLALANTLRANDLASGKGITDRYEANRANTDDGRRAAINDLTTKIKALNDTLAKGGLGQDAAAKTVADLNTAETQKRQLEDAQKRASAAEAELRRLREEVKFPDLETGSGDLRQIQAERQKAQDIVGPGNSGIVNQVFDAKVNAFFDKLTAKILDESAKHLKQENTQRDKELARDFDELNKKLAEIDAANAKIGFDQSIKTLQVQAGERRSAAELSRQRDIRMAEQEGGPGGQARAANLGEQDSIASAKDIRSTALDEINRLTAAIKAESGQTVEDARELSDLTIKRLQVEANYRETIDKAHQDAELKIAELQKQSLESYKQEATAIFEALRQPDGVAKLLRNQANRLAGQLFANATAPILQQVGQTAAGLIPGQADATGKKTGVGGLLSGTIFDSNRQATPQLRATDLNTTATDKNTEAINRLTGSGAPPSGGSPADALSQLVSSSSATTGSPAQALQALVGTGATSGSVIPGSPAAGLSVLGGSSSSGGSSSPAGLLPSLTADLGLGGALGGSLGEILSGKQNTSTTFASPAAIRAATSTPTALTGLKGLISGASSVGTSGNFDEIFHGGAPTWNPATGEEGTTPTFSSSQRAGAAAGDLAVAGTGAYEAYNQFSKGGASGIAGGIGAASLTAGTLAGGPSNPVGAALDAVGTVAELFKAILPDPREIRAASIQNQTEYNAYQAPPTLNRNLSTGGDETFTNKYGQVQVSDNTSVQETQPYKYLSPIKQPWGTLTQNWVEAPGMVTEPYQAPPPTPTYAQNPNASSGNMTLTINALDSQSILSRSADIATAVQKEVRNGHPAGLALQQSIIGT
jgi:hypothetical protein